MDCGKRVQGEVSGASRRGGGDATAVSGHQAREARGAGRAGGRPAEPGRHSPPALLRRGADLRRDRLARLRRVIVLDTHVWFWWTNEPRRLSRTAARSIERADAVGVC